MTTRPDTEGRGRRPRVVFAGTPPFAATVLEALTTRFGPPVAVYTQPDARAGRGRRLAKSAVKQVAEAMGVPVVQPGRLTGPAERDALASIAPDLMVVAAYGVILPKSILDVPRLGCVNVHASLLPRWRGAAPIQHALMAGDARTGITLMRMNEGLDTGDMLVHAPHPITPHDTAATLTAQLAALGARTLVAAMSDLLEDRIEARPQDDAQSTYAPRIHKLDARMDWREPAALLARRVRAFDPWPVAYTSTPDGTRLRVWIALALEAETPAPGTHDRADAPPGTVIAASSQGIDVATGAGTLRLLQVQPAGSKSMAVASYLNARRLTVGDRLGPANGD